LNLRQVAQAITEARSTYNKKFIDLDADLTFIPYVDSPKFVFIFSIVTMLALISAAVVIVLIIIKVRKIDIAVAMLIAAGDVMHEMIPRANAVKLTKVVAPTPEDTEPVQAQQSVFAQYIGYFVLILIGILVLKCLVNLVERGVDKLVAYVKTKLLGMTSEVQNSSLCLLVSGDWSCIMLHLRNVPIPRAMISGCVAPDFVHFTKGDNQCSYIKLTWDGNSLGLKVGQETMEYEIPQRVAIPVARRGEMSRLLMKKERFAIFMVIDKPIQYLSVLRWHDDLANTICCGKSNDKFESVEMNTMTSSLYPKLPSAPLESEEPKYGDKDLYDVTRSKETEMANRKKTNDPSCKAHVASVRGPDEARWGDPIANMSQADRVRLLARYAIPPCEEARRERKEMNLCFKTQAGQTLN